jgi:hypothetical protein
MSGKHNRSFFSDSSSETEEATSPSSKRVTPRRSADTVDLSNAQKFAAIEVGERGLEVVVEILSMTQNRNGKKGQTTVAALISGT